MGARSRRASKHEARLAAEVATLKRALVHTSESAMYAHESHGRVDLVDWEANERSHLARLCKTEFVVLCGRHHASDSTSKAPHKARSQDSVQRRPVSNDAGEALRRLRAKIDADLLAERERGASPQTRTPSTAAGRKRSARGTSGQSEMRRMLAASVGDANSIICSRVDEEVHRRLVAIDADISNVEATVILAEAARQARQSQSAGGKSPVWRTTSKFDEITEENRHRSMMARKTTESTQRSVIESKRRSTIKKVEAIQEESVAPGEKSVSGSRSYSAAPPADDDEIEARRSALRRQAEAVAAARLAERREELASDMCARVMSAALRASAQDEDARLRRARVHEDQKIQRRCEERRQQILDLQIQRRQLQKELSTAHNQALDDRLRMRVEGSSPAPSPSVRTAPCDANGGGDGATPSTQATATADEVHPHTLWLEDMRKHREMIGIKKRDTEEEEQRAAKTSVAKHLAERGDGSADVEATVSALHARRAVHAEKRRAEALAAARDRESLRLQVLDRNHAIATAVVAESAALLADAEANAARERLRRRELAESCRWRELENSFARRQREASILPSDTDVSQREYSRAVRSALAGVQMSKVFTRHPHTSLSYMSAVMCEADASDTNFDALDLLLAAQVEENVFSTVDPAAAATSLGCALAALTDEQGIGARGSAIALILAAGSEATATTALEVIRATSAEAASPCAAIECVLGALTDAAASREEGLHLCFLRDVLAERGIPCDAIRFFANAGGAKAQQAEDQPPPASALRESQRSPGDASGGHHHRSMNESVPATTRVLPDALRKPHHRSFSDFPSQHAIDLARARGDTSDAILDRAELLLRLVQEHDDIRRQQNRRKGDPVQIRRDNASLAAQRNQRLVATPSERLTCLSPMQEAHKANIPAEMIAERAALTTLTEGETMMLRHLQHEPVRSCSPRLYDPRHAKAAKDRQELSVLARNAEQTERREAIFRPLSPTQRAVNERVYTNAISQHRLEIHQVSTKQRQRFDVVTCAPRKAALKLPPEDVNAITARLRRPGVKSTARESRASRPTSPSLAAKASPAKAPLRVASPDTVLRLHAESAEQQRQLAQQLDAKYMPPKRRVVLEPLVLKGSIERLYTGAKA